MLHIHPINDKKLYNNEGVKFLEKKTKQKNQSKTSQTSKKEKVEPIRSAVRQVLDEAEVIDSKVKSSDTEGKE